MQRLRIHISLFFLALLLFPVLEKVKHELGHLHEERCDAKELHYCSLEHSCNVCDYVLSSSIEPSGNAPEFTILAQTCDNFTLQYNAKPAITAEYSLSLRGPPAC